MTGATVSAPMLADSRSATGGPPPDRSDRVGGNAVIASVSQAAAMISGGLLAVLVAILIGNDARTDGFFAAFAVYSTVVAFAQSARTTVVARLVEGRERFGAFNGFLGAAILITLVVSVAFGPLGTVLARLLTGDLPDAAATTAQDALLILWPAAILQLFAALGAAMLGALGDFARAGIAFVAGSMLAIVAFVLLEPSLGIDGLSVAVLIGSVLSASVVAWALVQAGWRPARETVTEPLAGVRAARVLTISSVSFLLAQLGFIVSLALGARLGVGVITVFTYAYMAMGLFSALFVSSIPMVLAVPLARSWDRDPASLVPHHEGVFRAGLLLSLPVVAAALLVGDELGRFVLADFTAAEVGLAVELFVIFSVNLIWGLAQTVPYAALVAVGRYAAIAFVTAGVVAIQIGLSFAAASLDSVTLLAGAIPASAGFSALACFWIVTPRYIGLAGPALLAILLRLLLAAAVAFGAPALVARALDLPAADFVALIAGVAAFAAIVLRLLPREWDILQRLAAAVPRPGLRVTAER